MVAFWSPLLVVAGHVVDDVSDMVQDDVVANVVYDNRSLSHDDGCTTTECYWGMASHVKSIAVGDYCLLQRKTRSCESGNVEHYADPCADVQCNRVQFCSTILYIRPTLGVVL